VGASTAAALGESRGRGASSSASHSDRRALLWYSQLYIHLYQLCTTVNYQFLGSNDSHLPFLLNSFVVAMQFLLRPNRDSLQSFDDFDEITFQVSHNIDCTRMQVIDVQQ
jgi:hypothetical protein